jgi:hypothetical protein
VVKVCSKCKVEKPLDDFYTDKTHKDGYSSRCKKCRCEWVKQKRQSDPDYVQRINKRSKKWRESNPERHLNNTREWYQKNPEYKKNYNRQYYQENQERCKAQARKWAKDNPDKCLERNRRRKAMVKGARIEKLPYRYEQKLFAEQMGLCWYCFQKMEWPLDREKVHLEHKIPLVRGGDHGMSNLCLTCADCNRRKHTCTDQEFREQINACV